MFPGQACGGVSSLYKNEGGVVLRNIALLTLIIPVAVASFLVSGYFVQKSTISHSPGKLVQHHSLYNPVRCGEVSYLHDQLAIYLKNKTGIFAGQGGPPGNQDNRVIKTSSSLNLPVLKNSARFAEIVFFYLADDDINTVLCGLKSGKTGRQDNLQDDRH